MISRAIGGVRSAGDVRPEERVAAGRVGAVVWIIASLSILAMAIFLPRASADQSVLVGMALAGCAWGAFSGLLLDYGRLPVWIIHASAIAGTLAIAVALELSGGARSPAWACLFYVVVFAAYFFKPTVAMVYFLACVVVRCVIVLVSPDASQSEGIGRLVVSAPVFLVVGAAIVAAKSFMWNLRGEAEALAAEQGALRRIATTVVEGGPAEAVYAFASEEAAELVAADAAGILRLEDGPEAVVLGAWAREGTGPYLVGDRVPLTSEMGIADALVSGRSVHVDRELAGSSLAALGYHASVVAPIRHGGRPWGLLTVVARDPNTLTSERARRLTGFGDLIAAAVASIEQRASLTVQALTDPLTGVANHRAFHERLASDLARARRHGRPVSVAMIDVDRFKEVNDLGGHDAGDELLRRVAQLLTEATRTEDTLARVGGDEFAWVLPETTAEEALLAVERARRAIVRVGGGRQAPVTISAGICDSSWTTDPGELVRLADRALYSSKDRGRDQVRLYSPAEGSATGELAAM